MCSLICALVVRIGDETTFSSNDMTSNGLLICAYVWPTGNKCNYFSILEIFRYSGILEMKFRSAVCASFTPDFIIFYLPP